MPDFILTMEEAQKKAKRAELSILDIELAMYAATSVSVLQSGDYKKQAVEWEGDDAHRKTWSEKNQAYLAAYAWGINRQRARATHELFTRAAINIMPPATADVMDALTGSLDNLALAATSDKTTVQHLTVANLALTTSVSTLTATNKRLTNMVTRINLPPNLSVAEVEDKAVTALNVLHPQLFGEITVGCMDTRSPTIARPAG